MNIETSPKKLKWKIQAKLNEYIRVLKIAEKPDTEEFTTAAKITGAGTILIGAIGFLFYLTANLLPLYIGG